MASRPSDGRWPALSPRTRRIAGWLAAAAIIVIITVIVGVLGGNADGVTPDARATGTPAASARLEITFGTAIDPVTGEVAVDALTDRFAEGDTFAYSVRPALPPPQAVYVEVRRTDDADGEVVQDVAEGQQGIAPSATVIAFAVPASNLFTAFGPGAYLMTIHLDPTDEPIAEGPFELVSPLPPSP
jgi:hypothetical protein